MNDIQDILARFEAALDRLEQQPSGHLGVKTNQNLNHHIIEQAMAKIDFIEQKAKQMEQVLQNNIGEILPNLNKDE